MSDFSRALEIAQIVAGACAKRYRIDYDACLSDAYFAVSKSFSRFDPSIAKLETYLTKCIQRQIFDSQRAEARRKARNLASGWKDLGGDSVAASDEIEDLVARALAKVAEGKRTDTVRRELRQELAAEGWSKNRISEAFSEIIGGIGQKVVAVYGDSLE